MLDAIISAIRNRQYKWSTHFWENLMEDETRPWPSEVITSIGDDKPEIIEDYPNDPRGASCLILGFTKDNDEIHTVVSHSYNPMKIVTAYCPSEPDWMDCRTRRT